MGSLVYRCCGGFHSTIRQFCIGHLHSDESVAALLRRFGLDAADFHDLCAELTGPTEFQSAGVHHQLEALVAEMHTDTWTSFPRFGTGACYSQRYSAARSFWQRFFFNFVLSRVLRQQAAAFRLEGFIASIAWSGIRSLSACDDPTSLVDFPEITIVDDTVCFCTAAAAEDLVAKVARGAELQRVIFSRHSLQLDYSRCLSSGGAGETAAIVASRGKGAKLQYTEFVMIAEASIAFVGDGLIPVTPDYKHLGSFQDPNCSLRHELLVRGAQTTYVAAALRRHILGCPWIDLRVCRMLALCIEQRSNYLGRLASIGCSGLQEGPG